MQRKQHTTPKSEPFEAITIIPDSPESLPADDGDLLPDSMASRIKWSGRLSARSATMPLSMY